MTDKMDILNELKERIMTNTNVRDQEKALEIARRWVNG